MRIRPKWTVTQGMLEREIAKARKAKAEDWVSAGLISLELAFEGPGRVGP